MRRVFKDAQTGEVLTAAQVQQRARTQQDRRAVKPEDIGVITEYVPDEE